MRQYLYFCTSTREASTVVLVKDCGRRGASAYVSIRQHTSAYVSIRQHTSTYVAESSLQHNLRQYLCFCTSKASTFVLVSIAYRVGELNTRGPGIEKALDIQTCCSRVCGTGRQTGFCQYLDFLVPVQQKTTTEYLFAQAFQFLFSYTVAGV